MKINNCLVTADLVGAVFLFLLVGCQNGANDTSDSDPRGIDTQLTNTQPTDLAPTDTNWPTEPEASASGEIDSTTGEIDSMIPTKPDPTDTASADSDTNATANVDTEKWAADEGGIHVATWGDDEATGTVDAPYATIDKAQQVARAGDRVVIHQGVYREILRPATNGTDGAPITFTNYHDDQVILSAFEPVSNWQPDGAGQYKAAVEMGLGDENAVMDSGSLMTLARWPNKTNDDLFDQEALLAQGGSDGNTVDGAFLRHDQIPDIDWTGGVVYFYGKSGWTTWRARITSASAGRVNFNLDVNPTWVRTAHAPGDGGEFYLMDVKGALDAAGEWYYDKAGTLYVRPQNGTKPENEQIEVRARKTCIDLKGRSFIHIEGLEVVGGSIEITGNATNNVLFGIVSRWGNLALGIGSGFSTGTQSVLLEGTDNLLIKSDIGFGSGAGVTVRGVGNHVENNHIHDFDLVGDYDAPVYMRGGERSTIKKNTIYNGGRDCIQLFNKDSEVAYNDVSHSNLIADDCGLLYTVGRNQPSTIHHNWFHDTYARPGFFGHYKAAAIYLDNDASYFQVYRNVIWNIGWSAIQQNWSCIDNTIFNNTMWNIDRGVMSAWHKDGTVFSNVRVWNNLSNSDAWEPQADKQNNLTTNIDPFTNMAAGDFTLLPNTQPVDAGRFISGITDNFVGDAPDVGAYETGDHWVAGADWTP